MIAYGDWEESNRVQELVQRTRYVWPWQRRRFINDGLLWPEQTAASVNDWPAGALVCQCMNVSRGRLTKAVAAGHCSVEALCKQTGASSVCGSCKPLLADLVGDQALAAEKGSRTLIVTAVITLVAALAMLLAPAIPYADSVQLEFRIDRLWRDRLPSSAAGDWSMWSSVCWRQSH